MNSILQYLALFVPLTVLIFDKLFNKGNLKAQTEKVRAETGAFIQQQYTALVAEITKQRDIDKKEMRLLHRREVDCEYRNDVLELDLELLKKK